MKKKAEPTVNQGDNLKNRHLRSRAKREIRWQARIGEYVIVVDRGDIRCWNARQREVVQIVMTGSLSGWRSKRIMTIKDRCFIIVPVTVGTSSGATNSPRKSVHCMMIVNQVASQLQVKKRILCRIC
ncbi:Hypothetical predicted protein [Olea europaea subsp. europaea]|uniref:Uncharacterized protein n=1 Tax=Olea europaea subsp. europaea TaxID=158383 RepID=A0A8S0SVE3_OLEEU|nr:Hypothetical predicted protein [Olea europaea subsp. europaea]